MPADEISAARDIAMTVTSRLDYIPEELLWPRSRHCRNLVFTADAPKNKVLFVNFCSDVEKKEELDFLAIRYHMRRFIFSSGSTCDDRSCSRQLHERCTP